MTKEKGMKTHSLSVNTLFNTIVDKAMMPKAKKSPSSPFKIKIRFAKKFIGVKFISPSYMKKLMIRPPAMTEAICPDTLTPIECISRKF